MSYLNVVFNRFIKNQFEVWLLLVPLPQNINGGLPTANHNGIAWYFSTIDFVVNTNILSL